MVLSSGVSILPSVSLGVFASGRLGVLPQRLQSPGLVAGAGEGACGCRWASLTAGQAPWDEAGVAWQKSPAGEEMQPRWEKSVWGSVVGAV